MNDQSIVRDERTTAVENASYRIAYTVVSFGLLAIVAYRGFFLQQSNWDLLALVVLSSGIATFYQGTQKIFSQHLVRGLIVTFVVALVVAAALVVFLR